MANAEAPVEEKVAGGKGSKGEEVKFKVVENALKSNFGDVISLYVSYQ